MRGRTIAVVGGTLALALGLTACGSSNNGGGGGGGGNTVDFYSSLPLQGASKDQTAAMVNGIKLAVSQASNKAGKYKVKYTSLDDSTAQAGNWDPGQTSQNARKVAQDSKAVYYIGEFNSGASAISIPILNRASVPQVSPANTYPGLTTNEPGTAWAVPGSPASKSGINDHPAVGFVGGRVESAERRGVAEGQERRAPGHRGDLARERSVSSSRCVTGLSSAPRWRSCRSSPKDSAGSPSSASSRALPSRP